MFTYLDAERFCGTIRWHGNRITHLVFPLMTLELLCSLWLVFGRNTSSLAAQLGLLLVAGPWVSTALLQVPLHGRLAKERDLHAVQWLVGTNWLRTVFWALRVPLVLWWLR